MSAQKPDLMSKTSEGSFRWTGLVVALAKTFAAVGLLAVCFAHMSDARADSASCLAKAAAFVTGLDELLEKERDSNRPYFDLVERYFPLRDCEPEALLDVVRKSRFLRSIQHNPRTNEYFIHFERGDAGGWFAYYATEKKSSTAGAGIRK
jgi:hypothetical protein